MLLGLRRLCLVYLLDCRPSHERLMPLGPLRIRGHQLLQFNLADQESQHTVPCHETKVRICALVTDQPPCPVALQSVVDHANHTLNLTRVPLDG